MDVYFYCHRPIVVSDPNVTLDEVLDQFVVEAVHGDDRVVDKDVILYWRKDARRIVTGADILGRLLQGIAKRVTSEQAGIPGPTTLEVSANKDRRGDGGSAGSADRRQSREESE